MLPICENKKCEKVWIIILRKICGGIYVSVYLRTYFNKFNYNNMKQKLFLLIICMMTAICANAQEENDSTYSNQNPPPGFEELGFGVFIEEPGEYGGGFHPAPPMTPSVYYNEAAAALFFESSCDGCTLRLIPTDEEEDEYTTVINSQILYLPLWLFGEYELLIVRGRFIFYTYIEI